MQAAPVSPAVEVSPLVQGARGRPRLEGRGPFGLAVRLYWGDRHVGEHLLKPGTPSTFTVGSAEGVSFAMGTARLGASRFELVRGDALGFQLFFTGKMEGLLRRRGEELELREVVASGLASEEGSAFALTLEREDLVRVELGGVRLELCFQPLPGAALGSIADRLDYTVMNALLAASCIAALFVVSASNRREAGPGWADELEGRRAEVKKIEVRFAPPPEHPRAGSRQEGVNEARQAHKGPEGRLGARRAPDGERRATPRGVLGDRDRSRSEIARMLEGLGRGGATGAVLSGGGLGGDLTAKLGGLSGPAVGDALGLGGLGIRGAAGGGGGTAESVGIGRLETRGRGIPGYALPGRLPGLTGSDKPSLPIEAEPPTFTGGIDRDLVRQVIHDHRSAIRYCYEAQLNTHPDLGGKVSIRFVINALGTVDSSEVAFSDAHHRPLEACVAGRVKGWQFPRPKGGGVVVVTYPFLFKRSGE